MDEYLRFPFEVKVDGIKEYGDQNNVSEELCEEKRHPWFIR